MFYRSRRYDSGKNPIWTLEELNWTECLARHRGKCERCLEYIEVGDLIVGATINGQGHAWDCWGQCGTHDDTELHEEIINGEPIMVRHVHRRELYWIHRDCNEVVRDEQ